MTQTPFDTPQELNLRAHREAGTSVWDRRGWDGTTEYAMACRRGRRRAGHRGHTAARRHRLVFRGPWRDACLVGADRPGRPLRCPPVVRRRTGTRTVAFT